MQVTEGTIPFKNYQTFYRIVGKKSGKTPLLLLHGGPGSSHNYFEVLDQLAARTDRQIIMYDQLGCGRSSIPDDHPELYNQETWIEELINLRQKLDLHEIHLLGQSWGGMLAIIYLCDYQTSGVKSVILSSTLSSARLWSQELHRLIKYLPPAEQKAILNAEQKQDFSSSEYLQANTHFMNEHVIDPNLQLPEAVTRPKKGGKLAYETAWGPNEYNPQGNLRNYEYTDKLRNIKIPSLITSGTDDLCTPFIAKTMFDQLAKAKWQLFPNCGHMPFVNYTEEYCQLLKEWMENND